MSHLKINPQAAVTPELATRGVFRLSRLSVSSYNKRIKNIPQLLNTADFFEIIKTYVRRLEWN